MKTSRLIVLWLLLTVTATCGNARSDCTGNEAWLPVGDGLPGPALNAVVWKNSLYVLHRKGGSDSTSYGVSAWNGAFWATMSTFSADARPRALAVYGDELYMGGMFTAIDGTPGTEGVVRWNGSSWKTVGGSLDGWASSMAVYNGEL